MKKANHQVNIVRITKIKEHTNADTLVIIPIGEYQVVSKKGQFNIGDLGVYIQPDSVVPQTEPFKFIWEQYMTLPMPGAPETFVVPEKRRLITVRKFRKEWSEGLLLPISDFTQELIIGPEGFVHSYYPEEGTDVSDILGITHYDPDTESGKGENSAAPKHKAKRYPRSFHGWVKFVWRRVKQVFGLGAVTDGVADNVGLGIPTYDVDALKNYPNTFEDGELVNVTEKIHGSNARFIYIDGVMYAGSRNLWKAPNSTCIFRRAVRELPWIEEWCKAHEGYVLWGELTPTQGGFEYGTKNVQFFPFDIRTPEGKWVDASHENFAEMVTGPLLGHSVPILYQGPYKLEVIKQYVNGPSTVKGAKNIREGVVIKTALEKHKTGVGRCQMKIVSNAYLEKDNK